MDKVTGAPLANVLISINAPTHKARVNAISPTRTITTTTNGQGRYKMCRIPAGDYTLTMQLVRIHCLECTCKIEDTDVAAADGKMERSISQQI